MDRSDLAALEGKAGGEPKTIAILLADGFMTLHLDLVTSMLRIANRVVGAPAFTVQVATPSRTPVSAGKLWHRIRAALRSGA